MTMCGFIFHNFLIDHAIPQDWMVDISHLDLDEEEELDHHSEVGNLRIQILDMVEIR